MKYIFGILLSVHGLIHLLGFIKAFKIAEVPQLTQSISKIEGMFFFFAAGMFLVTNILFLLDRQGWFIVAIVAVVISQILIIIHWQDAKYGMIANGIILIVSIVGFASWNFKNTFENDVSIAFAKVSSGVQRIEQKDIDHLPKPIQKYLVNVGVLGKQKVSNFKLTFRGEMRGREQDWFRFTTEQFSFFEHPTRLFFMKARVKGVPTAGYHYYQDSTASMRIKLFSIFPVVNANSQKLFAAETVTFFNDLCLFAPAALIGTNIRWETIDDYSVKAYFRNKEITIAAILYFNEKGQLINFVSDDRYDINEMKKYRFSTPVSNYKEFNGYMLPSYGEAIWHYPNGLFVYGKFNLLDIKYNEIPE